jgi:hypothetical protein
MIAMSGATERLLLLINNAIGGATRDLAPKNMCGSERSSGRAGRRPPGTSSGRDTNTARRASAAACQAEALQAIGSPRAAAPVVTRVFRAARDDHTIGQPAAEDRSVGIHQNDLAPPADGAVSLTTSIVLYVSSNPALRIPS